MLTSLTAWFDLFRPAAGAPRASRRQRRAARRRGTPRALPWTEAFARLEPRALLSAAAPAAIDWTLAPVVAPALTAAPTPRAPLAGALAAAAAPADVHVQITPGGTDFAFDVPWPLDFSSLGSRYATTTLGLDDVYIQTNVASFTKAQLIALGELPPDPLQLQVRTDSARHLSVLTMGDHTTDPIFFGAFPVLGPASEITDGFSGLPGFSYSVGSITLTPPQTPGGLLHVAVTDLTIGTVNMQMSLGGAQGFVFNLQATNGTGSLDITNMGYLQNFINNPPSSAPLAVSYNGTTLLSANVAFSTLSPDHYRVNLTNINLWRTIEVDTQAGPVQAQLLSLSADFSAVTQGVAGLPDDNDLVAAKPLGSTRTFSGSISGGEAMEWDPQNYEYILTDPNADFVDYVLFQNLTPGHFYELQLNADEYAETYVGLFNEVGSIQTIKSGDLVKIRFAAPASGEKAFAIATIDNEEFKAAFDDLHLDWWESDPVAGFDYSGTLTEVADLGNDDLADARQLTGSSAAATANNDDATLEPDEDPWDDHSLWWKWTAPASGSVTIDTNGSNFDTLLAVYTGTSYPLQWIASDDDGGTSGCSLVSFSATQGVTYQIRVSGYGSASGDINLSLQQILPLLEVKGLSNNAIAAGDVTPSLADGTDFGNLDAGRTSAATTFTLANTGPGALALTGAKVQIVGAHAGDFVLTPPAVSGIAASASAPFTVAFRPTRLGLRTATIRITSDDPDHSVYEFAIKGFATTGLFDETDYLALNPDVKAGVGPSKFYKTGYEHFAAHGLAEKRRPNNLWDEAAYLRKNPDVAPGVGPGKYFVSGFEHFVFFGQFEGRSFCAFYNEATYRARNLDVVPWIGKTADKPFTSGLVHFLKYGRYEGRQSSPFWDEQMYRLLNPDVAANVGRGKALRSGLEHWLAFGFREHRRVSALYDEAVYLARNADVAAAVGPGKVFATGFDHFKLYGYKEGRRYSNLYVESIYLQKNPDVAAAVGVGKPYLRGLEHFLLYGCREGRAAV